MGLEIAARAALTARPSRGLTSLGLDDDDLGDGIDFGSTSEDEGDDQFDVPEFLR